MRAEKATRKGEARWKVKQGATIYGFAAWWDATLIPGIVLSTSPLSPRTHWEQLYFPLPEPMTLDTNETATISLRSRSSQEGGTHLAWTATHLDAKDRQRVRHAMDLDKGYLP